MQETGLFVLGLLTFIPGLLHKFGIAQCCTCLCKSPCRRMYEPTGAYASTIIYCTWQGYPNYSYKQLLS